jgi:transmembrane sensor
MDTGEALALAARIASGDYEPGELDRLTRFLRSATPEQVSQVLEVYKENLDQQETHSLMVNPDFMDRLRALKPEEKEAVPEIRVRKINSGITWIRRASVAAFLLISLGIYFFINRKNEKPKISIQIPVQTEIQAPQTNRATITLANGKRLFLDSAEKGILANESTVRLSKLADGQITYSGDAGEILYNMLTNPRSSKPVSITLSDGSRVLLNAESSMTYPVAFTGKERTVEIMGEAYFEVTHNASMPFIVKKLHDDTRVEVIGTHFNVNTYDDEASIKVTLLEGSVKVSNKNNTGMVKPGQQAQLNGVAPIRVVSMETNELNEVMAWKNGTFYFTDADISTVMRQLARWYDFEVSYSGVVKERFHLDMSRNTHVENVFKILEETRAVHFKIEGKKITVMP